MLRQQHGAVGQGWPKPLGGQTENMRHRLLAAAARRSFYNTSPFDFARLLDDPNHVAANQHAYIGAYSPNVRDIMERLEFAAQVDRMYEKDLRFQVGGCQMLTDP